MEFTALSTRLIFSVVVLLFADDQHCYCDRSDDTASLRVDPNRLQFFEYDSIRVDCEGFADFTEWRVMRRMETGVETKCGSDWEMSKGSCNIQNAFTSDSGEYWCEATTGRSSSVNISITGGAVILESPAVPVTEGDAVTLSCRSRTTSSLPVADFYKDGVLIQTGYEGKVTIHNVSQSDEGLYKCVMIGVGESIESWLVVKEKQPPRRLFLLWVPVVGCSVALLLLLLLGLHLCQKFRVFGSETPTSLSGGTGTVSESTSEVHPPRAECSRFVHSDYRGVSSLAADSDPCITDEYTYYNSIDEIRDFELSLRAPRD
ncbi:high affinity immunoglobulin gamma Fc receptor I-like [Centropristis striata]|uniref:high affinity immunoglobulin gamma Fc receptor I-like n=1 Tax=Centropristis striata TaxID=184440 RepID=UPI0027E18B81|nr:high affinity immunoglobulin gamma Fc receptor I-like [Centropristis striata]